jgi:dTDP-4-dehydrorhamnose 3,5-epimerase
MKLGSAIPGVELIGLDRRADERGWLVEIYRSDGPHAGVLPAMAYVSLTRPGVVRGPHEHRTQTDVFAFLDGRFRIVLWENRPGRPSAREEHTVGHERPTAIVVPPGVVHAYQNIGDAPAIVINMPDQLYAGPGRSQPVDEIRHEADPESPFKIV